MKNNYYSSKKSRSKNSTRANGKFQRNFRNYVGAMLFAGMPFSFLYGQTNPAPQPIPYTQAFDSLVGANPSLPAGWQGWKLAGSINDEYNAVESTDQAIQVGGNNTNAAGIFDMTGKLGFLSTTNSRISPVLSVDTSNRQRVKIKYKLNVQRVNSNRIMGVQLQYRIGSEGAFTPVTESTRVYTGAGTGTNTTGNAVLAGETTEHEFNLPNTVNFQPFVQFRWVVARLEGGSGENVSFSVDDVEVTGLPQNPELIPAQAPYYEDFEIENWVVNNGTTTPTNRFRIATPTSEEDGKLYITNAFTGTSSAATYTTSSASNSYAYKEIQIPADMTSAKISFKWVARGEGSGYDAGRFFLLPPSTAVPTNGTEITRTTEAYAPAFYNAKLTDRTTLQYYLANPTTVYTAGSFGTSANTYTDNFVDLSQYAGQTVKAVFYWRNDTSGGNAPGLIIDDFSIDYTPNCLIPVTQAATNITGRTAQINWQGTGTNFEYYLSTSSTTPTATTTPTGTSTTNSVIVTGLAPSTPYYAWVRQVCEGNERTDWSTSSTFTTGVTCTVPTENTVSNISTTGATLNWTSGNQEFEYYLATDNTLPTATTTPTGTSTTNSVALTQLTTNTTYYWWVRSSCGTEDGKSLWSATNTFTTGQIPAAFPFTDNFNVNNGGWTILSNNTSATTDLSKFTINTPASLAIGSGTTGGNLTFADGKLFITSTSDNLSPVYKASSISYAYRDVTLPTDLTTAQISFKWLMKGESTFDYGRFFIVPLTENLQTTSALGNSATALNNIYTFNDNPNQATAANKTYINFASGTNSSFIGAYEAKAFNFQNNSVNLEEYAGQTVRVVFYFRSDGSAQNAPSLIIDDFKFDYTPQCLAPTTYTTGNITARTADVSWTASLSEPSNGYKYYLSTSATAPESTTEATGTVTDTTVSLTGLTPETTYYVWTKSLCSATEQSDWSSTNVSFTTAIACTAPTAPTASAIEATSATLGWTSTATSFDYYISTETTAPTAETEGISVEGNTVTVTNLQPSTNYNWWVRANCGTEDGKSQWTAVSTFMTGQIPAAFPFNDNFDTATGGWAITSNNTATTDLSKFTINTPTTVTVGTGDLTFANGKLFITSTSDNLSPVYKSNSISYAYRDVTLPADLTTAKVAFKWLMKGESTLDYGRFMIVPTSAVLQTTTALGNNATALNNIYTFNDNPNQATAANKTLMNFATGANSEFNGAYENKAFNFQNNAVDLAQYAGQTVRVLFYFRSDTSVQNAPSLIIDDFTFDYSPSCLAPTELTATNVDGRTAQINWTASTSEPANGYEYYVSTEAAAPTATTAATGTSTTTTASLTGLTPETAYRVWLRSVCSDDVKSDWSSTPLSFTTTVTCPAPTALTTTAVTTSSATLGWTSTSSNFEYVVSTTNTAPTADTTGTSVTTNEVNLTDLTPNTTYYWWVRANCGTEDGNSTWASSTLVTGQIPATYPYVDNFDNPQWAFANGTQANKFTIGTPDTANDVTYADNKLFVSNNGTSATYTITSASHTYAYRDIQLPADMTTAKVSFKWIARGETGIWDFGRFFITTPDQALNAGSVITRTATEVPGAIFNGTIDTTIRTTNTFGFYSNIAYNGAFETPREGTTGVHHLYESDEIDLSAYAGQTIRVAFYWNNDGSGGNAPSLVVDDFYFGPVEGLATGDVNKDNLVYYPNPVENELNFKGDQQISTIDVYNLAGQVVNQVKVGQTAYTLDTTKLTAGVYMVKVAFENGTSKTIKIIKK